MKRLWILVVLVGLLGLSSVVLAKVDPYVEPSGSDWGDVSDPTPGIWKAVAAVGLMGRLDKADDVDAFSYTFDAPTENWHISLLVPVCSSHFKDFYPSVALIGPGLDVPDADALPFALPDGMGAQVFTLTHRQKRTASVNNDMGLYTYVARPFQADVPLEGEYMLAVWSPDGTTGAYVLSTGNEHDQFAPRPKSEFQAAFRAMETGSWMGIKDC